MRKKAISLHTFILSQSYIGRPMFFRGDLVKCLMFLRFNHFFVSAPTGE